MMLGRVKEKQSVLFTVVEEFWLPATYPMTQAFIVKPLKTGRKLGEVMLLISQSPKDAINTPIFDTVVEQTVTKILLPNPDAEFEGSYERCGLTYKEFVELKQLAPDSRTFMVKQNRKSSLAKLDLYGFSDEMAVLSGNAANVHIMQQAIAACRSEHPDDWLPVFHQMRREFKQQQSAKPH